MENWGWMAAKITHGGFFPHLSVRAYDVDVTNNLFCRLSCADFALSRYVRVYDYKSYFKMQRLILFLGLCFCLAGSLTAQRRAADADERRTWFGAHTALGFGASFYQINYRLGLAPMYGYRVIPQISVGPRAGILYNHYRFRDDFGNVVETINTVDLSFGAFLRGQIYRQYFAQAEMMYEKVEFPVINADNQIIKGMNAYLGIGMNSGGSNPSFEVMLAYDLNLQAIRRNNLINGRFGFTIFY